MLALRFAKSLVCSEKRSGLVGRSSLYQNISAGLPPSGFMLSCLPLRRCGDAFSRLHCLLIFGENNSTYDAHSVAVIRSLRLYSFPSPQFANNVRTVALLSPVTFTGKVGLRRAEQSIGELPSPGLYVGSSWLFVVPFSQKANSDQEMEYL